MTEASLYRALCALLLTFGVTLFVFSGIATDWFIVRFLLGGFAVIGALVFGYDPQPFIDFLSI